MYLHGKQLSPHRKEPGGGGGGGNFGFRSSVQTSKLLRLLVHGR